MQSTRAWALKGYITTQQLSRNRKVAAEQLAAHTDLHILGTSARPE
jgi:hypothetical protein